MRGKFFGTGYTARSPCFRSLSQPNCIQYTDKISLHYIIRIQIIISMLKSSFRWKFEFVFYLFFLRFILPVTVIVVRSTTSHFLTCRWFSVIFFDLFIFGVESGRERDATLVLIYLFHFFVCVYFSFACRIRIASLTHLYFCIPEQKYFIFISRFPASSVNSSLDWYDDLRFYDWLFFFFFYLVFFVYIMQYLEQATGHYARWSELKYNTQKQKQNLINIYYRWNFFCKYCLCSVSNEIAWKDGVRTTPNRIESPRIDAMRENVSNDVVTK